MSNRGKFTVVVTDYDYPDLDIERRIITEAGGTLIPAQCRSEEEVIQKAKDAHGLLTQYAPISRKVIEALSQCRVIARYGIGVDNIDISAATQRKIVVVNVPSYCEEEVASHTLALILACVRKIFLFNQAIRKGNWDWKLGRPIVRLSEQKLGLIAFGKIAKMVARKARAFGFSLMGFDPYVSDEEFAAEGVRKVDLDYLLKNSDIICVHAPLTQETRHMLGREEFKKMKSSSFLVNTSRGAVVDEKALYEALRGGQIAGAALDVLEEEPPGKDSPLLKLDNVIFTPHVAWYSESSLKELRAKAATDLVRVLEGKTPQGFVNRKMINES
ncbi:C-terminal binding protein [Candidatus Aerophobetes bacterium]|uniref:C-terminal binding protein n=1 Tax=Aerophobetes bacterium TaxID=2030807 RepID=A0A497E4T3_UNCAE|nr:MAG: C-terminal binding protein [Candidatus Aerophobetes bacterium]